jgi:hypothetical protein
MERAEHIAKLAGMTLFDYQIKFLAAAQDMKEPQRACLYYKTGAGKSLTAIAAIYIWGYDRCVVIAPPATHSQWLSLGAKMGITVEPMSHAKFRMRTTMMFKKIPVIADEMHLFGGHKGAGWRKLDKLAANLQAPLILASATPNYNDAERVYCIQHVLDPDSCRGGYLQFLYQNCVTEQNPFGMEPIVTGFQKYGSAADYLAAMPGVFYVPDDLVYKIMEIPYDQRIPDELTRYGYFRRKHRIIGSLMEQSHTMRYIGLVNENGHLYDRIYEHLEKLLEEPVLIFAQHASIADAVAKTLIQKGVRHAVVTGSSPQKYKEEALEDFRQGINTVLIGTATLATGTDGLDKACDTLVILDDTDDDALRRQLIGRIMPRGGAGDVSVKRVYRFQPL